MAGINNYVPYTPSPNVAVTNDQAPSGFYLISAQTGENAPRSDTPTLTGILRTVGIPEVMYTLQYFTLSKVSTALTQEYVDNDPALQLVYFGDYIDNAMLIGIDIAVQPATGDRGLLAMRVTQNIVALGQRITYV